MMVAIPATPVVQGNEKQVVAIQVSQYLLSRDRQGILFDIQNRITQRPTQARQDGRVEQKGLNVRRLAVQDFFDQIVEDIAVVSGQRSNEMVPARILQTLHRQRSQLQAGDPALGTVFECRDLCRRQIELHHLVEESRGLFLRESQVDRSYLGQLPADPQARERKWRIGPAGDDEMQLRGYVVEQKGHHLVDCGQRDGVIVVEDEHKPAVKRSDIVDECRDQRLYGRGLKGLEAHLARLSQADIDLLQSSDDVREKAGQIVVSLVERNPSDAHTRLAASDPLAEQRGLAKTGRSGDEGQLGTQAQPIIQPFDQTRP